MEENQRNSRWSGRQRVSSKKEGTRKASCKAGRAGKSDACPGSRALPLRASSGGLNGQGRRGSAWV